MLSAARRLTWRWPSPAWASPSTPWSAISATDGTGFFRSPFRSLTQTAATRAPDPPSFGRSPTVPPPSAPCPSRVRKRRHRAEDDLPRAQLLHHYVHALQRVPLDHRDDPVFRGKPQHRVHVVPRAGHRAADRFLPLKEGRGNDRRALRDGRKHRERPVHAETRDALLEQAGGSRRQQDQVGASHRGEPLPDPLRPREDDLTGAQPPHEVAPLLLLEDRHDPGPHRGRETHRQVTDTADTGHRHGLPLEVPRPAQRREHRDPGAQERGGVDEVERVRDLWTNAAGAFTNSA